MNTDKKPNIYLDKKQALAKAQNFCAYQERSQTEVRYKLVEWGIRGNELEEVLSDLILNNFLNEERFAKAYASGKLRINHWGRQKIKQGLQLKGVPDRILHKALYSLDEQEYLEILHKLLDKKERVTDEKNLQKRKYKLLSYMQGRGFERELILECLGRE
ncbi:regulatory protein [Pedobacter sp. UYEF25]